MAKKKTRIKQKETESKLPSRRTAIFKIGAASLALPFILRSDINPDEFIDDRLIFLNREPLIDNYTATPERVYQNCVALCPEVLMSQGFEAENFQREWSDGISRELAEKGMLPSTKISLKTQFFGLPDKLDFMEPMKKYCEQAAQYLFSNLRGIINYNIEWTIIKAGDNFLKSCDKKGFIGNSYGYFARVFAENPHDKDNPISREAFSAFNGSTAYAHEWEPNSTIPPFKLVFIGVGSGALNAPFSELIGLSTTDRMNQKTGLSVLEDIQANEAMHEAVADSLMRGLLKELGVSNQANLISKASALMNSPRYFYVPNAGRFVQRNGIQAAYDLYMESPRKFLDAIKRI